MIHLRFNRNHRVVLGGAVALFVSFTAANAEVVNIDPDVNDRLNPIQLNLEAGTYRVEVIGIADGGIADAWSPWASTTCGDPAGCANTSPTTQTGWITKYDVQSPDIVAVAVDGVSLLPVTTPPGNRSDDFFLLTPTQTRYTHFSQVYGVSGRMISKFSRSKVLSVSRCSWSDSKNAWHCDLNSANVL